MSPSIHRHYINIIWISVESYQVHGEHFVYFCMFKRWIRQKHRLPTDLLSKCLQRLGLGHIKPKSQGFNSGLHMSDRSPIIQPQLLLPRLHISRKSELEGEPCIEPRHCALGSWSHSQCCNHSTKHWSQEWDAFWQFVQCLGSSSSSFKSPLM